ncbi:hypothetical protein CH272_13410 [Rhodococcus sp. 05-340-1]|uniref:radical SAM protein n=1 Tax=unclassified Rhodococcus (in: high G+C Gram-positive bacteria) TaxID=192944 RepID=UPI000B9B68E2|nr:MULTISPECIES: radical SAM protein [unclassified Rhodococcus (in: high G+C Gram-positive bacteria)]OZD64259.1 hypothetical protein CH271_21945 [Rhodococcus sp. 05-340-2]OZD76660.1 hypothetical protein CH272_13410 [Rhodococcus sp. 05-340-1]
MSEVVKHCAACQKEESSLCFGAFARAGIFRVHWECWSQCNLGCGFCYRTNSTPLRGESAVRLVNLIADGGARDLVFAGGDPSLRRDISKLCSIARERGLYVEVQTNAQIWTDEVQAAAKLSNSIALSLDGLSETHDQIRKKVGNFSNVVKAMDWLEENEIEYRVRSVVTSSNVREFMELGERFLLGRPHLSEWGIQELAQIGQATASWNEFSVDDSCFLSISRQLVERFGALIKVVTADAKRGAYAMIRSDGQLYGTLGALEGIYYPVAGDLTKEHLADAVCRLPFDTARQRARYGSM